MRTYSWRTGAWIWLRLRNPGKSKRQNTAKNNGTMEDSALPQVSTVPLTPHSLPLRISSGLLQVTESTHAPTQNTSSISRSEVFVRFAINHYESPWQIQISPIVLLEERAGHFDGFIDLFLFFFAFSLLQDFKNQCDFIGGEADTLFISAADERQHNRRQVFSRFTGCFRRGHPYQFEFRRIYILHRRIVHPFFHCHFVHLLSERHFPSV